MSDENKEFLRKLQATFRAEAEEHLAAITSHIVQLEQTDGSTQKELLERILKKLHTLKGASRAVNLSHMETLCHAMENVFSALRLSGRSMAAAQFDLLHQAGTLAGQLLDQPSGRTRNLATVLAGRLDRMSADITATPSDTSAAEIEVAADELNEAGGEAVESDDSVISTPHVTARPDAIRVQGRSLDAIRYQAEELLSVELSLQHYINDLLALASEIEHQREQQRFDEPAPGRTEKPSQGKIRPVTGGGTDESFERKARRIAHALGRTRRQFTLTRSRLMDAMLETALVPFGSVLEQLPGLVRNLTRSRGKQAVLHLHDDSVQIDRRVLDIMRETLIHLVTNAVDHGIEPSEQRLAKGKPATGTIRIKVMQSGDSRVVVMIEDDGAGIDVSAVTSAAIREGSLTEEQLAELDDRQKLHLALRAGVSTASQLTAVSGRGIGLSIVAEKVASVGGELTIDNAPGAGCSFKLLLPVRLATLRGLVVRVRGAKFVFPLSGMEAVRALKEGDLQTVENRETVLFAGRVVPAIRPGHLLGMTRVSISNEDNEDVALFARAAGSTFALLVDEILSEQEVLPKSLGKQLRRVRGIAGATQLGDGSLVPILAVDDIVRHALMGDGQVVEFRKQGDRAGVKRVLVVEDSITSRLLLKHILEGVGYQVDTAVDGLDALSRLRQENFDAVVSDVEMPHLDGLSLTERLRANPTTAEMPVILVTSLHSAEEKERGLRAGADAYVVKGSFDQDNLLKTIRRLI